jgi:hypothetical protein
MMLSAGGGWWVVGHGVGKVAVTER